MLPKKERLSREEFNRFFSAGIHKHSPSFKVVYSPHENLHVSVVVSKKVEKSAVKRNKIRRKIYDMVRRYHADTKLKGVFIFITKPTIVGKKSAELHTEVLEFLYKTQNN